MIVVFLKKKYFQFSEKSLGAPKWRDLIFFLSDFFEVIEFVHGSLCLEVVLPCQMSRHLLVPWKKFTLRFHSNETFCIFHITGILLINDKLISVCLSVWIISTEIWLGNCCSSSWLLQNNMLSEVWVSVCTWGNFFLCRNQLHNLYIDSTLAFWHTIGIFSVNHNIMPDLNKIVLARLRRKVSNR